MYILIFLFLISHNIFLTIKQHLIRFPSDHHCDDNVADDDDDSGDADDDADNDDVDHHDHDHCNGVTDSKLI